MWKTELLGGHCNSPGKMWWWLRPAWENGQGKQWWDLLDEEPPQFAGRVDVGWGRKRKADDYSKGFAISWVGRREGSMWHSEFDIPVRWWSRDIERQLEGRAWRQEKGQIAIFNPLKGCQVEKEWELFIEVPPGMERAGEGVEVKVRRLDLKRKWVTSGGLLHSYMSTSYNQDRKSENRRTHYEGVLFCPSKLNVTMQFPWTRQPSQGQAHFWHYLFPGHHFPWGPTTRTHWKTNGPKSQNSVRTREQGHRKQSFFPLPMLWTNEDSERYTPAYAYSHTDTLVHTHTLWVLMSVQ